MSDMSDMSDLHSEAMIVLDDTTIGIWFYNVAPDQDFLAHIREITPDVEYELVWRLRFKDKKIWHSGRTSNTRTSVIDIMRSVVKDLHDFSGYGEIYELLNDGDMGEFFRKFYDLPFVYA